jgi:hypothetical protein
VWQGLGFNAEYTYSHDITEGTGEWGNVQNYYDLQGSRGNEGWDQRQRFTLMVQSRLFYDSRFVQFWKFRTGHSNGAWHE